MKVVGYYLSVLLNYWLLMKFHEIPIARVITATGFLVLGMYRWNLWLKHLAVSNGTKATMSVKF